MNILTVTRNVA